MENIAWTDPPVLDCGQGQNKFNELVYLFE